MRIFWSHLNGRKKLIRWHSEGKQCKASSRVNSYLMGSTTSDWLQYLSKICLFYAEMFLKKQFQMKTFRYILNSLCFVLVAIEQSAIKTKGSFFVDSPLLSPNVWCHFKCIDFEFPVLKRIFQTSYCSPSTPTFTGIPTNSFQMDVLGCFHVIASTKTLLETLIS